MRWAACWTIIRTTFPTACCAGGKEDWKEIDGNYDWPTTVLTPGADGKLTFGA